MKNQLLPKTQRIPVTNSNLLTLIIPACRFSSIWLLVLVLILPSTSLQAQVNTYAFATTTGNTLETGAFTNLLGTNLDDDVSAVTNIGFTFRYNGIDYTTFSATSNGIIQLGGSATTNFNNDFNILNGPYLAAYWDDNFTDFDGNVQYLLMGVPGSQKLVVDFNVSFLGQSGFADKRFQIWLFETSNKIVFVYGAGNNFNGGFSVGITSNGTTDMISVSTDTHTSNVVTANNGNSTWPGTGRAYVFNGTTTLPVSILNFSGYKKEDKNLLHWTTANENENAGFEIQRSYNGVDFTALGFVASLATGGNSASILTYNFTDFNAEGTVHYYRLRQVDLNGKSKYSSVLRINTEKPANLQLETVFPNPARSSMNLVMVSPGKEMVTITLTDINGKAVLQKQQAIETGRNSLILNIAALPTGIYNLSTVTAGGERATLKVMIVQ